jgi:hypothetical protein
MNFEKSSSVEGKSVGKTSSLYIPKVSIDIGGKPITEKMRGKLGQRIFLVLTNSLETKCVNV